MIQILYAVLATALIHWVAWNAGYARGFEAGVFAVDEEAKKVRAEYEARKRVRP